ncbi:MAG: radical SAM/SPASM domain-containing protein [bacterium]
MMVNKSVSLNHFHNRFSLIKSYIKKDPIVKGFPVSLEVEVTNKCNLRCMTCPRDFMTRKKGFMSFSLFKKIIKESEKYLETVLLFHCGEPLLHPQIGDMIGYAKEKGIKTILFTNVTLLSEDKAHELLKNQLDMLVMSFDGGDKSSFEDLRKGAQFESVIHNMVNVLRMKKQYKSKMYTQIHFVLSKKTRKHIKKFFKIIKPLGVNSIRIKPFFNTGNIGSTIGEKVETNSRNTRPCLMLWREPVICWDGTMLPCCVDLIGQKPLGNIKNHTIHEVWNGKEMVNLREKFIKKKVDQEPLCRNCNAFDIHPMFSFGSIFIDDFNIRKLYSIFEKMGSLKLVNFYMINY